MEYRYALTSRSQVFYLATNKIQVCMTSTIQIIELRHGLITVRDYW